MNLDIEKISDTSPKQRERWSVKHHCGHTLVRSLDPLRDGGVTENRAYQHRGSDP